MKSLPWYYATRGLGIAVLIYGLVVDHTTDRQTILLGGFGLLGLDKVARSEKK